MRRWNLIGLVVSAGLFGAVASCQTGSSPGGGDPMKPDDKAGALQNHALRLTKAR